MRTWRTWEPTETDPNVHVTPDDDQVDHTLSEDCVCGPSADPVKRDDGSVGWVIVHHSLDGRERQEPDREPR